ncbi:MAG: hypothetical protein LBT93_04790 [Treponema sp.]|nr:hypothetical protein [Treponema sp.]
MKKTWVFIPLLVFFLSRGVFALELTVSGGAGNIIFGDDRLNSLGQEGLGFSSNWSPLGYILLEGDFSPFAGFTMGFERDALLRNRVIMNIALRFNHIQFEVGPFMGLFNTPTRPVKAGVSATLGLEFPGLLFGSIHGAATLGPGFRVPGNYPGDYIQEKGSLILGFWVPYVVCSLGIHTKNFIQRRDSDLLIEDEQIRYLFRGDLFVRNVPYTIQVNLGYQELKRSYTTAGNTQRDELDSLFIGFELVYMPRSTLRFFLGGEMPVYSWGKRPLRGPDPHVPLLQVHGGFTLTLLNW